MAPLHYFQMDTDCIDPYVIQYRFCAHELDGRSHIWRMDELRKLAICPNLKSADFQGSNLDDLGLENLAQVANLERLNIRDTKISDNGLVHLASLPRLRSLLLDDNKQLTNACVPYLLRLDSLTLLQIERTSIDQQGIQDLRTNLPNCTVLADVVFAQSESHRERAMTEQEWLACDDPPIMLEFLEEKAGERKLRLFAVGCCSRIMRLLSDQRSVDAVLVTDRYIDGTASADEVREAIAAARAAYENAFQTHDNAALSVTYLAADGYDAAIFSAAYAAYAVGHDCAAGQTSQEDIHRKYTDGENAERVQQAELLRHIIGNPFRHVTIDDAWLTWKDGTVPKLAQAIYDERAFDRLPILADALEESGCTNEEILAHCRGAGPHVRGCWVVDLIREKK